MFMGKKIVAIAFFSFASVSLAADCTDVIRLSKEQTEVVQGSSSLETSARNFCRDYATAKSNGQSMNVGVSYAGLGVSLGHGSASAEQIAEHYCDSSDVSKARSDAYRQYVEKIAPGAFSAYERCEDLRGSGVTISVNEPAVLSKHFSVGASFTSSDQTAYQIVDYVPSPDVKCAWKNGLNKSTQTKILANGNDTLACRREIDTVDSSVTVFVKTKPKSQLAYKWTKFKSGLPADTLGALRTSVGNATSSLGQFSSTLKGAVVAFALAACPQGWSDYAPAYGRFVRGIDNSNQKLDPDGQRLPGAAQADSFASHSHVRPVDAYNAGFIAAGSADSGASLAYSYTDANGVPVSGGQPLRTANEGAAETRPKNVSLLYCIRN